MKAVILAGGLGTRLSEETSLRPKPMVEIGYMPILWHIMKIYSAHGINDFIICLGYKGYMIKEYFANYFLHMSNVTIDMASNKMDVHQNMAEPWRVTLIETGGDSMTGGRIKRIGDMVSDDEAFCLTYGDGVGDVDISALIELHNASGLMATLTTAQPPGRFGMLKLENERVSSFQEKPIGDGGWVNAGFFVLSPKVLDFIEGDNTTWENEPLENLAKEGQLGAYRHNGFWQPMDTMRDKANLERLWDSGQAPWKTW